MAREWIADQAPTQLAPQTRPSQPALSTASSGIAPSAVATPSIASFVPDQARAMMAAPHASPTETTQPTAVEPSASSTTFQDEVAPISSLAQKRLLETVPADIEPYFDLFMYVSKSTHGPLAQHMFIFQRDADGKIIPYAEWKVSTGREKIEIHNERKVRTNTPEGIFKLDPGRMYAKYWSHTWNNAPMHYAMFYDLMNNGNQSGLAIHAAVGHSKIARLGRRDSAGCIRLSPKNAAELFYKVRNTTKGRVPVMAMNQKGSTDRWGHIQHDGSGSMLLQDGYRAVLFVENFDGREEISGPVVAYTN